MTSQIWNTDRGFVWWDPSELNFWMIKMDGYLEHLTKLPEGACELPDDFPPEEFAQIKGIIQACRDHVDRITHEYMNEKFGVDDAVNAILSGAP